MTLFRHLNSLTYLSVGENNLTFLPAEIGKSFFRLFWSILFIISLYFRYKKREIHQLDLIPSGVFGGYKMETSRNVLNCFVQHGRFL